MWSVRVFFVGCGCTPPAQILKLHTRTHILWSAFRVAVRVLEHFVVGFESATDATEDYLTKNVLCGWLINNILEE